MEPDTDTPGPRIVSVNQIVAWNIAWYRRKAGFKQADVEEILGWREGKLSEAERSWDGKRTREFNAQELADFAGVYGVPVMAFFLPPLGEDGRELFFPAADGDPRDMTDLMWLAMHDSDDERPAFLAYRDRFRTQAHEYLDPEWAAQAIGGFEALDERGAIEEQRATLRAAIGMARAALADLDRLAGGTK